MKNKTYIGIQNLNKIDDFDCSVITTDHEIFDYDLIYKKSKLIFDTRNVMKNKKTNKKYYLLGNSKY